MKIKKLILPLATVAILATACNEKKVVETKIPVALKGAIANDSYNGQDVYLQKMNLTTGEVINVDTAKIDNGTFSFNDSITESPIVGLIAYQGSSRPIPFIMEAGTVELEIDSTRKVSIKGTARNTQYQQFMNEINNPDATTDDYQAGIYNYIKSNLDSPIGEYFLMTRGKHLNGEQLKELLTIAEPKVKGYANYESLKKRLDVLNATAVGKMYTDIKGLTPDGKEISLSEYAGKGKYVLVDFWASWCPPCRKEMPAIVELYKKYKTKGFEIVGVSIDDKNDDWKKGIADLKITWPQISDLEGWKSPLAETYGVTSIPQTFLLDQEGKIMSKNLDAEQLAEKLKELLK